MPVIPLNPHISTTVAVQKEATRRNSGSNSAPKQSSSCPAENSPGILLSIASMAGRRLFTRAMKKLNNDISGANQADSLLGRLLSITEREKDIAAEAAERDLDGGQNLLLRTEAGLLRAEFINASVITPEDCAGESADIFPSLAGLSALAQEKFEDRTTAAEIAGQVDEQLKQRRQSAQEAHAAAWEELAKIDEDYPECSESRHGLAEQDAIVRAVSVLLQEMASDPVSAFTAQANQEFSVAAGLL